MVTRKEIVKAGYEHLIGYSKTLGKFDYFLSKSRDTLMWRLWRHNDKESASVIQEDPTIESIKLIVE